MVAFFLVLAYVILGKHIMGMSIRPFMFLQRSNRSEQTGKLKIGSLGPEESQRFQAHPKVLPLYLVCFDDTLQKWYGTSPALAMRYHKFMVRCMRYMCINIFACTAVFSLFPHLPLKNSPEF